METAKLNEQMLALQNEITCELLALQERLPLGSLPLPQHPMQLVVSAAGTPQPLHVSVDTQGLTQEEFFTEFGLPVASDSQVRLANPWLAAPDPGNASVVSQNTAYRHSKLAPSQGSSRDRLDEADRDGFPSSSRAKDTLAPASSRRVHPVTPADPDLSHGERHLQVPQELLQLSRRVHHVVELTPQMSIDASEQYTPRILDPKQKKHLRDVHQVSLENKAQARKAAALTAGVLAGRRAAHNPKKSQPAQSSPRHGPNQPSPRFQLHGDSYGPEARAGGDTLRSFDSNAPLESSIRGAAAAASNTSACPVMGHVCAQTMTQHTQASII